MRRVDRQTRGSPRAPPFDRLEREPGTAAIAYGARVAPARLLAEGTRMARMPDTSSDESHLIFQRLDQTARFPYTTREYLGRFLWECVEATCVRWSPRRSHRWRRFWLRRFGAHIGPISATKASTRIVHPWLLSVGEYSMIAEGVTIYNLGRITIGSHTVISQDAYLCGGTHDYTRCNLPLQRAEIRIGSGVWIGAGAFVGPGITVGDNSVIGARAVVTSNVPPGVIVAGNPARVIKPRPMGQIAGA